MHRHWNEDERAAWHFAGRGGPGGGWGKGGRGGGRGFGGNAFRMGKMIADGDLRIIVLALLEDGPRHGYDIIKALEERSSGIYVPSPGVVYPTLTYLEEVGYVTATAEGNKRIYAITDTGRAHLDENRDVAEMVLEGIEKIGKLRAQAKSWWENQRRGNTGRDRDIPGVIEAVNEARRDLKAAIAEKIESSEDEQKKLAKILTEAAAKIRKLGKADIDL